MNILNKKIEKPFFLRKNAGKNVKASICLMGLGQLMYGQIGKGLLYLAILVCGVLYFISRGFSDLAGLFTLGTKEKDAWFGIEGDNSVVMLLMGILFIAAIILFIGCYLSNIRDIYETQTRVEKGGRPRTFTEDVKKLLDEKFYKTALFLPVIGVFVFSILPIIFMIAVAFTNYGGNIVPPELVDWVGFRNFIQIATLSKFAPTFGRILSWNLLWAASATFLNYFAGLGLALLLNKKCVRGTIIWRAFPILAYAVPGFITLLGFRFMFSYGGPINQMIMDMGHKAIGFLDIDAKWMARLIGLLVNAWITVPSIMLLATGILTNLDTEQLEAAKIDGAKPWKQFTKIVLPFVLFSTTPVLIGQFIGNFNNFGIFFFLRGGLYMDGYFLASDTDLLINWLYNLSISNNYYNIGAAISLVIFLITSMISLFVYVKSPSYKEEDVFR
ncbi:arabinogalactan oligomer/maltooligosaccharide transport system permease protein [Fontibacillus phaseoli]|uniref:Maltose/maltodextrin transport system permease protein n=1 Tax=Fontibacillus phaseoli TaxID=1416533 RepID=A0A369B7L3_9BACL|nr:sugar ABC transporter permease [Fontibacillus phaseoli]RCX15664.1 arabinogalactan oligomer/maltooligosaccharide transport system permease protein [Fontibacillus phaseoli]